VDNDRDDLLLDDDGQIRSSVLDDLLVEVISGKLLFTVGETMYAARTPTMAEQDAGRIIYRKTLARATSKGLMTRDKLEQAALDSGEFRPEDREEKASIIDMMKRYMRGLDKTPNPAQRGEFEKQLNVCRERLRELSRDEIRIFAHAAEIPAEEARLSYYVSCCTLGGEILDERVWPDFKSFHASDNWPLIHAAKDAVVTVGAGLSTKVIRAIARHAEWRVRWKSCQEASVPPFDGSSANWDRTKLSLIYWSNFYDNILQHPECPDEDTVNDDDALGAWLNVQVQQKKNQQRATPGRRPPMINDGKGNRRAMTKIGSDKVIQVGQPVKIRV
jgi:hypothetical protein